MRIAIIGSSRGLGLELVKSFLSMGHCVFATTRKFPSLDIDNLKKEYGSQLQTAQADVADEEEMKCAANTAKKAFGELDALIHSAGILLDSDRVNPLDRTIIADLRSTLDVNLIGPVVSIKTFLPIMKKNVNSPFIIVTSEGCEIRSAGSWIPAYALSKCAATKIVSIMNTTAVSVRFIALHPGRIRTEMGRETWQIEASQAAASIARLVADGMISGIGSWYIDYQGNDMLLD